MEALKDFFSDLKDRISNPFISSFVVSWLIINYQIVIPLLFYKQNELQRDGYTSYINLIFHCYNENNLLWHPLAFAFAYTFGFSIFKSLITIFQSSLLSATNSITYWLTKKTTVTVEYHEGKLRTLDDEKKAFAKLAADGKQILAENELLKATEQSATMELESFKIRFSEITAAHDASLKELNKDHDKRIADLLDSQNHRIKTIQDKALENFQALTEEKVALEKKYKALVSENNRVDPEYPGNELYYRDLETSYNDSRRELSDAVTQLANAEAFYKQDLAIYTSIIADHEHEINRLKLLLENKKSDET